jgi:flavin reductase (DIM6/NTAB) family NADH-FMN oxidoreductase RutF
MTTANERIDPRDFRNTLGRFATGVTVITTEKDGQIYGMTANALTSVSLNPPLVLVAIDHRTNMHKLLSQTKCYGVSILSEDQEELSSHFARRPVEGLKISFVEKHGMPLLEGAVAQLVARVVEIHPAGDHSLYIGQVEHLEWTDERPLLFFAGQYHHLKVEKPKPSTHPEDDFSLFLFGNV